MIKAQSHVSEVEVRRIKPPSPEGRWFPIGFAMLLDAVGAEIKKRKLTVTDRDFGLAKEGRQLFGTLALSGAVKANPHFGMMLGVRGSIDKTLANAICVGSRVFVCDNMAFSGEIVIARRNTTNCMGDLPGMIADAFDRVPSLIEAQTESFQKMRTTKLLPAQQEHIIIEAAKRDIIPASKILMALEANDKPEIQVAVPKKAGKGARSSVNVKEAFPAGTAWTLFNALTWCLKSSWDSNMVSTENRTRDLSAMFAEV